MSCLEHEISFQTSSPSSSSHTEEYIRVGSVPRIRRCVKWAIGEADKASQTELAKTGLIADYVEPLWKSAGCILLCGLMLGASGCAGLSEKKIVAAGKIADSYYNSANVAELWTVTSSNGTGKVTFENFSTFTMNTPVPPKTIIPREPTFWEGAWDTVKTLGPWAFFGYALGGGGLANHTSTTVNNTAAAAQ